MFGPLQHLYVRIPCAPILLSMVTLADILEAYYACRRNKRRTVSAVEYEMHYERGLISLRDRINSRNYRPGTSICFVVSRPRYREVFAASFEDRIIHHYIALRIEPLMEAVLSPRTFGCRHGKGQLYGVRQMKADIVECSEGYTRDCYVMKLDIKGFFMSIPKADMTDMIDALVADNYHGEDKDDLRWLCRLVIMHRPETDCVRHSPMQFWAHLSADKSLFTNGEGRGLAIGNLFAQLFANYYLSSLDRLIESLGFVYYGRYVDDICIIHTDKRKLLEAVPVIRRHLRSVGLRLNERKFYLQHYAKGVEFTGAIIKPGRSYSVNRVIRSFEAAMDRLNRARTPRAMVHTVRSVNSYLGILIHHNEYAIRRRVLGRLSPRAARYVHVGGRFTKVCLNNRWKKRVRIIKSIRCLLNAGHSSTSLHI